jgi:hypothetical protein
MVKGYPLKPLITYHVKPAKKGNQMSKNQITSKISQGILKTTSTKVAKTAQNMPDVQHLGTFNFVIVDGEFIETKPTHYFAKKVTC